MTSRPPAAGSRIENSICNRGNVDRRHWLMAGVGAVAALATPSWARASAKQNSLQIAAIGCSGMGWSDLSSIGSHASVRFVGFCDIDASRFEQADRAYPKVPHFADYREMLETLGDKVDAVIVSTPDHMHAPIATMAMSRGKHVYCQKPLTHTVWEARHMKNLAIQKKLTTQMGNQIHSANEYRSAVKMLRDGVIGKVQEVHSWVGVQGRQYCQRTDRPASSPVPEGVRWDLWLGAAPERPFAPDVYHPFKWRDWQDFGSGALGDFGCHILDPVFTALELTAPKSIIASNEGTTEEVWPGPETVRYLFPGTRWTQRNEIRVTWYDGGKQPDPGLVRYPKEWTLPGAGSLFVGEDGMKMMLPHVGAPLVYKDGVPSNVTVPSGLGSNHWHDWVDAVIEGRKTTDGFEVAGPLTETVQLGNIAARLPGKELLWDAEALKITNSEPANRLLTKSYTRGFEITLS